MKDITIRLEEMNKKYIRKPECKQTLEDAIQEIKDLRDRADNLYDEIAYNNMYPEEE